LFDNVKEGLMAAFEEWELHRAPYVDEQGEVEVTAHVWESFETKNAYAFIDEIRGALDKIEPAYRSSADVYFRRWEDQEGYPCGSVSLNYRRPASEEEVLMDKARQRKSWDDDRSWIENRLASLLEEATRAGLTAADLGIGVEDGSYIFVRRKEDRE
jgi:hypothetical protein